MILTRGDAFADLCSEKNLGRVVDFQSPEEIAAATQAIIDDSKLSATIRQNIRKIKKEFFWPTIAKNIAKIIEENRWNPRKLSLADFLPLTLDFYKAGLRKKLAK